jgi:hypothetical protein
VNTKAAPKFVLAIGVVVWLVIAEKTQYRAAFATLLFPAIVTMVLIVAA